MNVGQLAMIGAVLCWGLWGYASREAVQKAHPMTVQWLMTIPQVLMLPVWYYADRSTLALSSIPLAAVFWSCLSCVMTSVASLLFSFALRTERASVVISVTSAYPLVVLSLLAITGKESLGWMHVLGCLLITAGVVLVQIN